MSGVHEHKLCDVQQKKNRQSGFSLVEISIVTTIVMLIAILGIPAIQSYVIESKVPRVAEELQRFVARMKATTQGVPESCTV